MGWGTGWYWVFVVPCRGVHHHAGRIDLAQKTLGVHVVAGKDGIGVVTAIAVDMGNSFVQPRYYFDGDDRRQIFGQPCLCAHGEFDAVVLMHVVLIDWPKRHAGQNVAVLSWM